MSVTLLKGISRGVTKVVKNTFPKGTIVENVTRHGGKYIPCEVVSTKRVYLSPENPLYKQGLVGFVRQICQDGRVHLAAFGKDESKRLACGIKDVKQLINSMKKFDLKV
ncbi:hypothetical protein IJ541_05405 [bacterium]|nr:hypothetical protein [bacterium]